MTTPASAETAHAPTNAAHIHAVFLANTFISLSPLVDGGSWSALHAVDPLRRTISECIDLLPENSTATIDPEFAKDVGEVIESHREPLNPPAWD